METKVFQQHQPISPYLTPEKLYQRDPLLRLFKDKWHLNIVWFITGSFILLAGVFFGLNAIANIPFTPKFNLVRVLNLFGTGLFYAVYFYVPDSISNLFNVLIDNQVVLINDPLREQFDSVPPRTNLLIEFFIGKKRTLDKPIQDQSKSNSPYEIFLDKFINWIDSRLWIVLTLPFIIFYAVYSLLRPADTTLIHVPFWLMLIGAFINLSVGYTCVLSIARISITLFFLNQLLHSFTIRINPLHPDGAGGLGILRQILWNSAGIMLGVALSFYVDAIYLFRVVDFMLLVGAYAILIPTLLIGWLILPHRVMLRARSAILQPLTNEYNRIVGELKDVASEDTSTIAADTERLSELTKRYQLWHDTFPIWPLEAIQIYQLLIAFILPALIAALSAVSSIPSIINFFTKSH